MMQIRDAAFPLRFLLVSLFLGMLVSTGCASRATQPPEPAQYTVSVGGELRLSLPANRTTGFSWALGAPLDSTLLELVEQRYVGPEKMLPGAGGRSEWAFRGVAAGATSLTFVYRRPWEEGVAPARTITYSVRVVPGPALPKGSTPAGGAGEG